MTQEVGIFLSSSISESADLNVSITLGESECLSLYENLTAWPWLLSRLQSVTELIVIWLSGTLSSLDVSLSKILVRCHSWVGLRWPQHFLAGWRTGGSVLWMGFASSLCVLCNGLLGYEGNIPTTMKMAGWLQIWEHPVTCSYAANPSHTQSTFMSAFGWIFFWFLFVHFTLPNTASLPSFTSAQKQNFFAPHNCMVGCLFRMKGWRLGSCAEWDLLKIKIS